MSAENKTVGRKRNVEQLQSNTEANWTLLNLPDHLKTSRIKTFTQKSVIYREGESIDTVYFIRSGLVKLLHYLPGGRARIVRLHGAGAWLGLCGLLDYPYAHTAVSIGEVDANCIPVGQLSMLKQTHPQEYVNLVGKGYQYLSEADRWISEFSTGPIKPRVARLVRFLSEIEHGKSSPVVDLLTVHEMADILGVTAESVSRTLAEFKRAGVLRKREGSSHESYSFDKELHEVASHELNWATVCKQI